MTKRRTPSRINEEHVCLDSFIQHLKEIDSKQIITYSEEPNDPPDFWVTISETKYAVEVTSIADYSYEALVNKYFRHIRSELMTNNIINGTYSLYVFGRPSIPKIETPAWKQLILNIAKYIKYCPNASAKAGYDMLRDKNGRIEISKISDQGNRIYLTTTHIKREKEIREEYSKLIKERIEIKQKNLKRTALSVNILIY